MFRDKYVNPPEAVRVVFTEPSLTKQSFRDESNINRIVSKYRKTGLLDHVNRHQGFYGDVTGVDYQTALHTVMQAEESFGTLPADLRKRFDNDPGAFLAFMADPAKREEQYALGLRERPPEEPAPEVSEPA